MEENFLKQDIHRRCEAWRFRRTNESTLAELQQNTVLHEAKKAQELNEFNSARRK